MNARLIETLRIPAIFVVATLVFAGNRYFPTGTAHWWLIGCGVFLMIAAMACAGFALRGAKSRGHNREEPSWRLAILWQLQIIAAFAVYFVYAKVLGTKPAPDTFLTKALLATWLLLGTLGFFMGLGVEWAQMSNGRGDYAEPQRVRMAAVGWLKIGMLAVMMAALNFVAVKKNVTWDLSYLKTTQPGESTVKMLQSLGQDVEVVLFFPQGNEVLSQARLYFDSLGVRTPKLTVQYKDVEVSPVAAEDYKVSRNGFAVLRSGGQTERFDIGLTITAARKNLKNIDADFQKALLGVTEKRKNLYFTRGHGELSWSAGDEGSPLKSIKLLEGFLRNLNFNMRYFGVGDGATREVPADADAVVVVGGDQPFLDEEARAIQAYVENGGRLLVMFDIDAPTEATISNGVRDAAKDPLVKWLAEAGLRYEPKVLANTENFVAATRSDADVWFLFSNVFTSHESVQSLARNEQRAAVLTFRSGYFVTSQDVKEWKVTDTIRSLSDTFVDETRDFKFNEAKEKREPRVIGAVAERKVDISKGLKPGRIVAFADASTVSDPIIRNQANLIYFVDGLRWLVGDVKSSGVASSEEDIRIRHTNKEDVAWFYGTIALVPGLVLILGAFATRRARRPRSGGVA